jgi:hypothetical protein
MITSAQLYNTDTTLYTSTNTTAITALLLCNTHTSDITVSVHVVESGGSVADNRCILKDYVIPAKDTFTLDMEKIILDNGDFVSGIASSSSKITATVSSVEV